MWTKLHAVFAPGLALFRHFRLAAVAGLMCGVLVAEGAAALPDWRRDGRVGYAERQVAEALARAFTRPGAPYAGRAWRVVSDPDGGYTPVFFDPPARSEAGS